MPQNWPFKRNDVFPSFFANRIQDFLSAAETNLRITRKNATTIEIVPDAELGIAAVALEGRWRFIEETISRAHPGGVKGTYFIWAVALDSDVDNTPDPFTDHTVYAFDLRITSGVNPSGEGVEVFEKIGEIDWSGAAIEAIRQTHGSVTGPMIAPGALSNEGDLSWKQEPNGAWVPDLKAKVVTTTEVADTLKPSAGAAAGTEALRALGATSSTATAGNDVRLSDERTPKDNSTTLAKLTAAVVEALVPTGTILPTGRPTAPSGYLFCEGQAVNRTTYATLFAAIGTTYGAGNGSTTFNLPDLRGRVPVGADGAAGRLSELDEPGKVGGEEKHLLSEAEMPSHSHTVEDPGHKHRGEQNDYFIIGPEAPGLSGASLSLSGSQYALGNATETAFTGINLGKKGGGGKHNNMQPFQIVNYMIKT